MWAQVQRNGLVDRLLGTLSMMLIQPTYFILAFTLDPQAERGPRVLLPHSPLGILTVNLLALFHRIGVYLK